MKKFLVIVLLGLVALILCGCMDQSAPPQLGLSDPNEKIITENIIMEEIVVESIHVEPIQVTTWDDVTTGWD